MGTSSAAKGFPAAERGVSIPVDEAMIGACPGWYYDPDDQAIYRWFDGENWTDHRCDIFSSEAPVDLDAEAASRPRSSSAEG